MEKQWRFSFNAAVMSSIFLSVHTACVKMPITSSRRRDVSAVLSLIVFIAALFAYALEVRRENARLAPPPGVNTLSQFAHRMPSPTLLKLVKKDGRQYIIWYGELAGPLAVPSGRSCYIFDDQGHLVHWQPETGDGGFADDFDGSRVGSLELSLDEALECVLKNLNESRG